MEEIFLFVCEVVYFRFYFLLYTIAAVAGLSKKLSEAEPTKPTKLTLTVGSVVTLQRHRIDIVTIFFALFFS